MNFKELVLSEVSKIPYGKVATYGQIALLIGRPRAARQVGWILNRFGDRGVWWRVINGKGYISIKGSEFNALDQKLRLESEGIEVSEDFEVDLVKYRYQPTTSGL